MCIICLFEFSSGIAGYVLRSQTAAYLDTRLRNDLSAYNESTHAIWDLIQSNVSGRFLCSLHESLETNQCNVP